MSVAPARIERVGIGAGHCVGGLVQRPRRPWGKVAGPMYTGALRVVDSVTASLCVIALDSRTLALSASTGAGIRSDWSPAAACNASAAAATATCDAGAA